MSGNKETEVKRSVVAGAVVVMVAFVVSRIWAAVAGIEFDMRPLEFFWQYIEKDLLLNNLTESIWYLHSQPPGFNLFLGGVLKLSGSASVWSFKLCYLLMGAVIALSLYFTLIRTGVSVIISSAGTVLFIAGPSALLYENFLFYTYPVTALLMLSVFLLSLWVDNRRALCLYLFFSVAGVACLVRSMFHLLWLLVIAILMWVLFKSNRKQIIKAAALPVILVMIIYLKNFLVFGKFTTSTWMGMSLSKLTVQTLDRNVRYNMLRAGELSAFSGHRAFDSIENYSADPGITLKEEPGYSSPVLNRREKKSGVSNYNHYAYIDVSDNMMKDALTVISADPFHYLRSVGMSLTVYTRSTSDVPFLYRNLNKIKSWDTIYNRLFYGQMRSLSDWKPGGVFTLTESTGMVIMILIPLLILYGAGSLFINFRSNRGKAIIIGFILFNIIYVTVVGNMFEIFENNRFRFTIEPLSSYTSPDVC